MRKLMVLWVCTLLFQGLKAQYCIPNSDVGTGLGSFIDSVGMLSLSSQTGPSSSPFYQLFTDVPVLNLELGGNYNLTVVAGTMVNDFFTVWVDWNNDLDFDDAGERMGEQSNAVAGQTLTFPFDVPSNTSTSFKRMRIRCGPNVNLEPCTNYTYGETEDYRLLIQPAPSNYCVPSSVAGSGNGVYIEAVRLNEFIHSTGASSSPFYGYADTLLVPKITQGSTQQLNIVGGSNTFMRISAWIDWNRDGDFYDAGENLGQENNTQSLQGHSFYFTVPDTLDAGVYRLRVRCAGSVSSLNPCANYTDGETEDYRVEVIDSVSGYCNPTFSQGTSNNTFLNRIALDELLIDLFSSSSPLYYLNYSNDYRKASLKANRSYMLNLGAEGDAYASTRYGAWIDFNRDGDFNDVGEYLGETQMNSNYASSLIAFTTPSMFETGHTRMRIIAAPLGASPLQACGNYTFGECKDFGVELLQFSAGLCVPENGNTQQGDFIQAFSMGDIHTDEGAFGASPYHYYGDHVLQTTPGAILQLNVQSLSNVPFTRWMSAWIDWNNNLEFEASEQVGLDTLLANAGSNAVWNVSVPGNQATGFVHIRIRCVRNALNDTTAFTACSSHAFGETEDYRIYVQPTIPTYCTNLHSNTGFSGVSINKVNLSYTELNKTQSGCEALSGNAYTSWPITTTTCGALVQSQTYYLSVDVSPNSRVGMWFDANQNGQFESSEFNSPFTVNGNTFIYLISIPTNIPTGYSRIRIRVRDGGSLMAAGEACTLFTSGETEDFPIFIANARGAAPVAGFTVVQSGAEASYSSLATNFSDTFDWNFLGADNTANPGTDPTAYYFSTAPGCWATALTVSNFYGSDTYVNPCAVYIPETTTCDQLMISEYLCGSSQNKAIELVNASNNALNLSDWSIALFTDGSNVPSQTLNLNGSLLPYQTYVLANPAADPAIQANANILSGICSYTGNDVIALVHQGTIVDMVGVIGENPIPGWAIGASATHAIDMRRDITVSAPNADWNNALSGWIAYPSNTFDNLGTHDFNCGTFQSQTPQAAFGISQNIICVGDCINLIDQSSGTPSSWIWTLPGSLNGTANGANPGQICYDTPGTYAISLTVTGTSGFDTETLNAAVTVLPYPTPSIALNGSTLTCNGCVGDVVWYWNGEPVPDANGSQLEAFAPGTYSLSSTNAGGCTGTSISVKVFTVGIQSNATPIAHVYPNPAQDWIYIQRTNEAVNLKYALRDAMGRIVQQGTLQGSMNKLEFTKQLASGIYMLSLWHDEAPQHFRIIKN